MQNEDRNRLIKIGIIALIIFFLWFLTDLVYRRVANVPELVGKVSVGEYSATLYKGDLNNSRSFQDIIDDENSAAFDYLNGIPYIADHSHQGFDATEDNDTLELTLNDVETIYTKLETHTSSQRKEWVADDGTDIYEAKDCDLITQTCLDDGVIWILWKKN